MKYEVFPFGKHKGVKLKDLPSTYIVLAIESFSIPEELKDQLEMIILGRIKAFSRMKGAIIDSVAKNPTHEDAIEVYVRFLNVRIDEYEQL